MKKIAWQSQVGDKNQDLRIMADCQTSNPPSPYLLVVPLLFRVLVAMF
ncbi:MAG: hypothetical protein PHG00_09230 [Methylococcales bacterium]|nr:hypothetical protein [Methylococcales bacterium]